MVFPAPSSRGAGVRVRVLGIPVRFDSWFFIIGVLFNIQSGVDVVVVWLIVLGGSVLVHELGHALVARTTGAHPEIVIHGLGGLTSWLPPHEVSRTRRIVISLAGPAAGISLGLVFLAARNAGLGDSNGLVHAALQMGIYINILYGLLNLLPILPLDGGQTMRDLLPGDDAQRGRVAAIVSIVVGIAVAIVAVALHFWFGAVFVALFVAGNVATLRAPRAGGRPAAPPAALADAVRLHQSGDFAGAAAAAEFVAHRAGAAGDHGTEFAALQLAAIARLDGGDPQGAKQLLLDLPAGSVDQMLEGRILVATGQAGLGVDRLWSGYSAAPSEASAHQLAAGLVAAGELGRLMDAARGGALPQGAVVGAARGAMGAGAYGAAGELAEIAGRQATGPDLAAAAYLAARAWARAGVADRALLALRAAVSADPALAAAARAEPSFTQLRGGAFDAATQLS